MRVGIDCRKIADFGIGTYVRELVRALAAQSTNETLVLFGPRAIEQHLPPSGRIERVEVDAPHYSIRELGTIGRAANAARLDVFHAPHYVVPLVRGAVVVTIHDLIHLDIQHQNPLALLYARGMIRRATRRASRIITVTAAVATAIAQRYPGSRRKIRVVHNGVEQRFFDAGATAPERPYFLWVGNDKPHKNLRTLVEGWRRAAIGGHDLVLAGAPPDEVRSAPGIRIAGFVAPDDLPSLYAGATALVLPSLHEGFGLPVAEAMAAGCPVIASDIPPLREVAGEAALFCDPNAPEAFAAAMRQLASSAEERERLRRAGRAAAGRFQWSEAAERTLEIYRQAMLEKVTR